MCVFSPESAELLVPELVVCDGLFVVLERDADIVAGVLESAIGQSIALLALEHVEASEAVVGQHEAVGQVGHEAQIVDVLVVVAGEDFLRRRVLLHYARRCDLEQNGLLHLRPVLLVR